MKEMPSRSLSQAADLPQAADPLGRFKDTVIGSIPTEWDVVPFGKVATLQRGKDLPRRLRNPGSYPVVGFSGVLDHHSEFVARGPGMLVGRSGSVEKTTWVAGDYWPPNTTLRFKDFHQNDPRFVYYFCSCSDSCPYVTGVNVLTLNWIVVHPVKVAIPSLAEQRRIAHVLSTIQEPRGEIHVLHRNRQGEHADHSTE